MRTPLKLHTITAEEVIEIRWLASSGMAEPVRLVQRARIIAGIVEHQAL